ncbi:MAG: FAD-binding oxidoreductase [Rhodobacteraceae bacterium]|nr:FAD-binding oxidoreductase [Paracoccaceae bacterium]
MTHIVVLGGGIVGISVALSLQKDGHAVTVIEPAQVGQGASWASCGCIAVGEVVPLSQPGMLRQVPKWLLDSEAPLAVRPATALRMLPWFLKFAANSTEQRMRAIAADLAQLTFQATADFKSQMAEYGVRDMLIERPIIKVFDGEADKATMGGAFDLAREMGCTIDDISGAEAHEIDGAIAPDFRYASVLRDWSFVADCVRLVQQLHTAFEARGGRVVATSARGFKRETHAVTSVVLDTGEEVSADEFVLAAGTGTKALAADLGVTLPIEGLMGYWTGLPEPQVDLKHTVFYPAGGFGITPHENTLAVAGTIEIASLGAKPNWRRADVLVERARRVLPGLNTANPERRIGRRPFVPDTRPVIGRPAALGNVVVASGHGQLGLTLGATTGRMVSDIIAQRATNTDMKPFSPDRF